MFNSDTYKEVSCGTEFVIINLNIMDLYKILLGTIYLYNLDHTMHV